jgi:hypothetical protein
LVVFWCLLRRELSEETRWVIPPNSTINLVVQFASETVGRFSEVLVFDVLNGEKSNKVTVMASCDYPRINTEARYSWHTWCKEACHSSAVRIDPVCD